MIANTMFQIKFLYVLNVLTPSKMNQLGCDTQIGCPRIIVKKRTRSAVESEKTGTGNLDGSVQQKDGPCNRISKRTVNRAVFMRTGELVVIF